jgi:hypothetical protein
MVLNGMRDGSGNYSEECEMKSETCFTLRVENALQVNKS